VALLLSGAPGAGQILVFRRTGNAWALGETISLDKYPCANLGETVSLTSTGNILFATVQILSSPATADFAGYNGAQFLYDGAKWNFNGLILDRGQIPTINITSASIATSGTGHVISMLFRYGTQVKLYTRGRDQVSKPCGSTPKCTRFQGTSTSSSHENYDYSNYSPACSIGVLLAEARDVWCRLKRFSIADVVVRTSLLIFNCLA
jgi:hypothetical protein